MSSCRSNQSAGPPLPIRVPPRGARAAMGRPCAEQCTTAYTQRVVSSAAMTARGTANLAGPNLLAAAMLPLLVSNAVEFFAYVGIFVVVGLEWGRLRIVGQALPARAPWLRQARIFSRHFPHRPYRAVSTICRFSSIFLGAASQKCATWLHHRLHCTSNAAATSRRLSCSPMCRYVNKARWVATAFSASAATRASRLMGA